MKIEFNRESMLNALGAVSGACPAKSPKPVLQLVKLTVADDGTAQLSATDLEVGVAFRTPGIKVELPGSVLLPPVRFGNILKAATVETLDLFVDDGKIKIRGPKLKYDLASEDPSLFPDVPQFVASDYHEIASSDLKRLIRRTMFCTDIESSRYALGGVVLEMSPNVIRAVATDGRRLSVDEADAATHGEPSQYEVSGTGDKKPAPVVPMKAVKWLERHLDESDPPVHVAMQDNRAILFRTDRATLYSRLVEGRYPKYGDVFPRTAGAVKVNLDVQRFREVVGQAAITTSEESRGVDFGFTPTELTLKGQACDVGNSEAQMEIAYEGPSIEVTYDPRYLSDAFRVIGDDEVAEADIREKEATVFSVGRFRYALMPLSRER